MPFCPSKGKLRPKLENILPLETVSSIFPRPLSPSLGLSCLTNLGCQNFQTCGYVIFTKWGCLHPRKFLLQPFHCLQSKRDMHPILELKVLNIFLLPSKKFPYGIYSIIAFPLSGDFLASVDIKDAYPIFPVHRCFLRVCDTTVTCPSLWIVNCTSSSYQTAGCCSQGIPILLYLDNLLLREQPKQTCQCPPRYSDSRLDPVPSEVYAGPIVLCILVYTKMKKKTEKTVAATAYNISWSLASIC